MMQCSCFEKRCSSSFQSFKMKPKLILLVCWLALFIMVQSGIYFHGHHYKVQLGKKKEAMSGTLDELDKEIKLLKEDNHAMQYGVEMEFPGYKRTNNFNNGIRGTDDEVQHPIQRVLIRSRNRLEICLEDFNNTHRGGERERTRKCMNGKCSKFVTRVKEEQFTCKSHAGRRETYSIVTYYIFNRRYVRM